MAFRDWISTLVVAASVVGWPAESGAAHSYDGCSGTVTSLPATLTAQGTWCLTQDLNTSVSTGAALTIASNNVTLDCNGYRIGGLPAGPNTLATGVFASARMNLTIRNCNIRGFYSGVAVTGGANGALVEDNRLDGNRARGIYVEGVGHVIRGNRVMATGGALFQSPVAIGVVADDSSVTGNVVTDVAPGTDDDRDATGIRSDGYGNEISRNEISGLEPTGQGIARGIDGSAPGAGGAIHANAILSVDDVSGDGIDATAATLCSANRIIGYATAIDGCTDAGDNADL